MHAVVEQSMDQRAAGPLFVSADAARTQLQWIESVERLRAAYSIPHTAQQVPPRAIARGAGGWLRTMSAVPPGCRFMGAKVFGIGPLRQVNYAIILIEQESGLIAGIVDGAAITAIRTAATSAIAVDRLAVAGPLRLGVLGSGEEARGHVEAIAAVRGVSALKVYSPTPARREAFADDFRRKLGVEVMPCGTSSDAAEHCDVLIAAARSKNEQPIVYGSMLRPGTVTVSIGSTLPEQREADVSAVAACDLVVCDALDEVRDETGDMIACRDAGIDVAGKLISLNALLSGQCDDRVGAAHRIMFKSVGSALQDIVIAELAFERALAAGSADQLPVKFYTKLA